jgi:hypothetical protein
MIKNKHKKIKWYLQKIKLLKIYSKFN